ncbi:MULTISPECIES: hypothetical protein [unclassified Streptomyces]|uniref:hypothetical protein n=1 Tax=unclassified Streptomyces TaxID=2593676 RepID=UPI0011CE9412|nr:MULTISPECIES: hypothetical protein [unclassified Streptomyces]MCX4768627.1 hypothetical protein [Streptomyces sp. NBC_01285]
MLAGQTGDYGPAALHLVQATGQQLFIGDTQRRITRHNPGRVLRQPDHVQGAVAVEKLHVWSPIGWLVQHEIFSLPMDELPHRILRDDGPRLAWFAHLEPAVSRIGEAKGWSRDVRESVTLTLEGVVATHEAGTPRYSASRVAVLADGSKRNVTRTIELLAELGRLDEDRADPLDQWLERNLACLPTGIRTDVADWVDVLRNGNPRRRPKAELTWKNYLLQIRPTLLSWSTEHETLREISKAEVVAALEAPTPSGGDGHTRLTALRSLFAFLKTQQKVFADPSRRLDRRVTRRPGQRIPTRLPASVLKEIGGITHTPATWLVTVLTGHHALGVAHLQALALEDADLPNRRFTVQGQPRPLDDLTHQAIQHYLDYRNRRWPSTTNPHLLITQQTAHHDRPASRWWLTTALRGQEASLDLLRQDRILDEVEAVGVRDPLHIAAVFGLRPDTAQRYVDAVHGRNGFVGET